MWRIEACELLHCRGELLRFVDVPNCPGLSWTVLDCPGQFGFCCTANQEGVENRHYINLWYRYRATYFAQSCKEPPDGQVAWGRSLPTNCERTGVLPWCTFLHFPVAERTNLLCVLQLQDLRRHTRPARQK